ncbi:MAG: hypothetical protein ABIJ37_07680 [Pseudomonadota bacterium]
MAEKKQLVGGLNDQKHIDEIIAKVNSDEEFLKQAKKLTVKTQNLMLDVPGGIDRLISWELENGKIISGKAEEKPAPSDWRKEKIDKNKIDLRATAGYEVSVKLYNKEINATMAIMSGRYKMQGSVKKIIGLMTEMTLWADLVSTVPCEV